MRPPYIRYDMGKLSREIVAMRGINYSDLIQDGDMRDCRNISARRYPYFSSRRARTQQTGYSGATALTSWDKLIAVVGTDLLYDGSVVGQVTAGEKQFAVVNTKLVIWPDMVYLDINTRVLHPLGAEISGSGASFTTDSVTVSWGDLTERFAVGDAVTISGCSAQPENNKDVIIRELTATTITVSSNAFSAGSESGTVSIERRIPELDFICESENRLWGCSSSAQTIYASALGDPTNFYVYEGLSTDSYALAVGSEGDFTGCCRLSSSVLFWKEATLHKMLGGFPAEYSLYTYEMEGLQAGSHKSLQVINEVLFYLGVHGVYTYSGGAPSLISANFGDREFSGGVAGNDGDSYYLSVTDGTDSSLYVFETRTGIWVREDDTRAVDFARAGRELYFLNDDGEVWLADNRQEDPDVDWMVQFTPFYETITGRKRYTKLLFRLELPRGSRVTADIRTDGGLWRECGRALGAENDTVTLRVPIGRCDKFEVRLRGKGPAAILSQMREFSVGSDV